MMFIYKKIKISQFEIGLFHVVTPCRMTNEISLYLQIMLSSALTRQNVKM